MEDAKTCTPPKTYAPSKRPARSLVLAFAREEAARAAIPPEEIFGATRAGLAVWARWRVMRRLRDMGYSLPGIGLAMGRDHSTVLCALRRPLSDTPPLATRPYRRRLKALAAQTSGQ